VQLLFCTAQINEFAKEDLEAACRDYRAFLVALAPANSWRRRRSPSGRCGSFARSQPRCWRGPRRVRAGRRDPALTLLEGAGQGGHQASHSDLARLGPRSLAEHAPIAPPPAASAALGMTALPGANRFHPPGTSHAAGFTSSSRPGQSFQPTQYQGVGMLAPRQGVRTEPTFHRDVENPAPAPTSLRTAPQWRPTREEIEP